MLVFEDHTESYIKLHNLSCLPLKHQPDEPTLAPHENYVRQFENHHSLYVTRCHYQHEILQHVRVCNRICVRFPNIFPLFFATVWQPSCDESLKVCKRRGCTPIFTMITFSLLQCPCFGSPPSHQSPGAFCWCGRRQRLWRHQFDRDGFLGFWVHVSMFLICHRYGMSSMSSMIYNESKHVITSWCV